MVNEEYRIPFNRVSASPGAFRYMEEALRGGHVSGAGHFTEKCQQFLEEYLGAAKALLTTSGTHALEMSALLLDIKSGDEVIVPSFTFPSTANAFVLRGALPVFVDIRPDTLNLDETLLEARITPRTRAIVPVHYAGVGCEMDAILALSRHRGIAVVEDNAHGLFGSYRGRPLGTLGVMAAQSFHETKNVTCGEGGALIINGPEYVDRAEILREKGTDRSRFFRGQVDKYSWVDLGSSYLPSDLLAALLYSQFEEWEAIQAARRRIWDGYATELRQWAADRDVQLPSVPSHCEQPYHLFYLVMPTEVARDRFIRHLKERQIYAVFHYLPLHLSVMGRRCGGRRGECPVAESVSSRLVRLPLYRGLSEQDQRLVLDAVLSFAA